MAGAAGNGDPELSEWLARRCYRAQRYSLESLRRLRLETAEPPRISVVLPAREVARTIAPIIDALGPLRAAGVIDELVVIDAASADGTAAVAEAHGATVVQEDAVLAEHGPALGKGDALWRSLAATSGEIVVFLDADTENFDDGFLRGLVGPLLEDRSVALVKGAYRRPFRLGEELVPDGGGRVTELVARPLLNLHLPQLAGFAQPLAGELAARRTLLEQLPFPVGYGVEIGTLIDALRVAGLDALAQVDLGERHNPHQSLRELSAMACAVIATVQRRIDPRNAAESEADPGLVSLAFPGDGGRLERRDVALRERPPLASLALGESGVRQGR